MARLRAADLRPEQIAAELQIPIEVARDAAKDPRLEPGAAKDEAQAWWDGSHSEKGAEKHLMAKDLVEKLGNFDLYCALPEEVDGWAAGASVSEKAGIDRRSQRRCGGR